MKNFQIIKTCVLVFFTALFFTFAGNSTLAQMAPTPDAVVKDMYRVHNQKDSPILGGKSRKHLDKFFDKNLANLIWNDLTIPKEYMGVLDSDPFYNTQDDIPKNLTVGRAKIQGAKATVAVSFMHGRRKDLLTYLLVKQNGAWKISDIKYSGSDTLLKYFKESV